MTKRKPKTFPLRWDEDIDAGSNTIWTAASPLHDDGAPFHWHLAQSFTGNRVAWHLRHSDDETLWRGDKLEEFASADAAKAFCQARANEIVRGDQS